MNFLITAYVIVLRRLIRKSKFDLILLGGILLLILNRIPEFIHSNMGKLPDQYFVYLYVFIIVNISISSFKKLIVDRRLLIGILDKRWVYFVHGVKVSIALSIAIFGLAFGLRDHLMNPEIYISIIAFSLIGAIYNTRYETPILFKDLRKLILWLVQIEPNTSKKAYGFKIIAEAVHSNGMLFILLLGAGANIIILLTSGFTPLKLALLSLLVTPSLTMFLDSLGAGKSFRATALASINGSRDSIVGSGYAWVRVCIILSAPFIAIHGFEIGLGFDLMIFSAAVLIVLFVEFYAHMSIAIAKLCFPSNSILRGITIIVNVIFPFMPIYLYILLERQKNDLYK